MLDSENSIVLIFNGEIYNFKQIRAILEKKGYNFRSNTDSEVILHGYKEYGEKIISLLRGMFAFAIWDIKQKKLLLARDRIGIKPLYYYFKDNKFIFSSEIKSILLEHSVKRTINHQTLSDYLSLRYSPGDQTLFEGIKKLLPGHYLVYKDSKIEMVPYWNFPEFSEKSPPDKRLLDNLISSSIKKRLISDVPIGVFLSGGLDSSAIVAYMSRYVKKIKTFSIGFNDPTDELKYAKLVSDEFGTEHTEIISNKDILSYLPKVVWHMDDLIADPSSLPTYLLSEQVSKKAKVVLAGEGGDEVFGGYQTINYIRKLKLIRTMPKFLRQNFIANLSLAFSNFSEYPRKQILKLFAEILTEDSFKEAYRKMYYFPFGDKDKSKILSEKIYEKTKHKTKWDKYFNNLNFINNAFSYYMKESLPNYLLMKVDKMSMAHSLEIRVPFLDTNLVNYCCGLSHKYKYERYLFRKTVENLLPKKILKRKKQGFTLPMSNWFCKKEFISKLRPYFEDLEKRNFFNKIFYRRIINNPSSFRNDHRMWLLLFFELWCKIHLDETNYKKIKI
jgi:asparagine synthase (glutamine-hydrolysing)